MSKACPFCNEMILETALKCKHCGEFVTEQHNKKLRKDRIALSGGQSQSNEYISKKQTEYFWRFVFFIIAVVFFAYLTWGR